MTQRLAAIIDVSLTVMGLPGTIPEFLERGLGCVKEGVCFADLDQIILFSRDI